MRYKLKRILAVMLIAAMTIIPAFSSLAAEMDVPEYFPFDTSSLFWPGWSFGMASPSDMMPGFIPGMGQGFWGNPKDLADGTFDGGFEDPQGGFGNPEDHIFVSEEPPFPGMIPAPDMSDEYYIHIEADDITETETEDDIITTETETIPEEGVWTVEDEDSGNGDYVKLLINNISGRASSDTLETDYIERLFYGEPDTTLFTDYWRSILNRNEQNFYDDVKEFIQEIAASDEVYPVFDAAGAAPSARLTKAQLGLSDDTGNTAWCEAALDHYEQNVLNVKQVIDHLYRDDPACFYWADRSYIVLYGATVEDDHCIIAPASIYFPPESDWEGDYAGRLGRYEIVNVSNEDMITAAKAAENAREIVEDHLEEPESEMMASFEEAVSRFITYDSETDADSSDYDDPWMLVYIFDNDPLTTVTDVGYPKALLCLREMSGIDNAALSAE